MKECVGPTDAKSAGGRVVRMHEAVHGGMEGSHRPPWLPALHAPLSALAPWGQTRGWSGQ
eukprot:354575-Chlamydomonas_euryale.AAC.14